ncbi:hypothetical protein BOTCAL_0232g00010 [Botryotinia calthae]|uniref:Uncharacterized protein n=1 Tax=Botryotinia calthae TaxID=38488 RepID=A0A4Y8D030_9HELO|nr:hypothetical protein BOTCAL_0232g00010 [Botryotinia calthae]
MASKRSEEETTVSTKWGPVVIFNGTNYPYFRNSVVMALAAADALGFIDNTEEVVTAPAESESELDLQWQIYQSYIKRKGFAICIINSAIDHIQRAAIVKFILAGDIKGSWDELAELDQAKHPSFVANVRRSFELETFDPNKQTIRQFIDILLNYQIMISTSESGITDTELKSALLWSLPGTGIWLVLRLHAINNKLTLRETIQNLIISTSFLNPKSVTNNGGAVDTINKKNNNRGDGQIVRFNGGSRKRYRGQV